MVNQREFDVKLSSIMLQEKVKSLQGFGKDKTEFSHSVFSTVYQWRTLYVSACMYTCHSFAKIDTSDGF